MKNKTRAMFMIYLIVTISFALYQIPEVSAEQQACCQFTKQGEACVYTDSSKCGSGLKSFTSCDNTDYCKLGTCIEEATGTCSANVGKSQCLKNGGTWESDSIDQIPQCQPGCCQLGTECSFITQRKCVVTASQFPGLQPIFDENIGTEQACINSCKSLEKGACVFSDKSCEITSRAQCTQGKFNANLLCSNTKLNTLCAPQQTTDCLKEDVYWFDSCGNPENPYHSNKELSYNNGIIIPENKIDLVYGPANKNDKDNGNCQYPERNICGKVKDVKPDFGNYICVDIDCSEITEFPEKTPLPYTQTEKKTGESWCLYESQTGFGYDYVGSRHFRSACVNGEEVIEPCRDYREEFCIQNTDIDGKLLQKEQFLNLGDGYSEAMCRPNRYDECSKANDPTLEVGGDCNQYSGRQRESCAMQKTCNDFLKRDCYWQEGQNEWGGRCVPLVPPGSKFWDASASEKECAEANQQCKVTFSKAGVSGKVTVLGPKSCTTKDWVLAGNTICKAQGDCGAWRNILEKPTTGGFGSKPIKIWDKRYSYEITDIDVNTLAKISKEESNNKWREFAQRGLAPIAIVAALGGAVALTNVIGAGYIAEAILNLLIGQTPTAATLIGAEAGVAATPGWLGTSIGATPGTGVGAGYVALVALQVIIALYVAYQIVEIFGAREKKKTFETYCNPWEAPDGGDDCEECNNALAGCTEYRCRSLGKSCRIINEGTEEKSCVSISQYDTKSPVIIQPATGLGYTLQQLVKPFTPVELFLETDEPAQCKFSLEPNTKFDEMQFNFGSTAYRYVHDVVFGLPSLLTQPEVLQVTNDGQYTLYIKCKDSNGNSNSRDYYYKFAIDKGPDLTAPTIEFVSPIGPYVKNDINQLPISMMVSEPANCKWSTRNTQFEQMQEEFTCVQDPFDYTSIYYGLYECNTILDVTDTINNYFFKCQDISANENTMIEPYKYTLKSTDPLEITDIEPTGKSNQESPILKVITAAGAENGKASCGYSETPNLPLQEIALMQDTNSTIHEQKLLGLQARTYTFYVTCIDIAGNQEIKSTTFEVAVDKQPPKIYQLYIENDILHIITSEDSKCEYGNVPFSFDSGISMTGNIDHQASLDQEQRVYYIKCKDQHDNIMSSAIYP